MSAGTYLGTTGGHADNTDGLSKTFMGNPNATDGIFDGPDEA